MAMPQILRNVGKRFGRDEQGVVTVEWVTIAGIFVVIAVVILQLIGGKVTTIVTTVDDQMETSITDPDFPGAGG